MEKQKEAYPLGFVLFTVLVIAVVFYKVGSNHAVAKEQLLEPTETESVCVDKVLDRQMIRIDRQLAQFEINLSTDSGIDYFLENSEKEELDEAVLFCSEMANCIANDRFIGIAACVKRELSIYN